MDKTVDNEIIETKNEVSTNVKEKKENVYGLASLRRIFYARLIDLIISAIPAIIVSWTVHPNAHVGQWGYFGLTFGISIGAILVFFVLIPALLKGNTIGKYICGIRIKRGKGDKKVKWYMLLARETYFLIIPWFLAEMMFIIALAILLSSKPAEVENANTDVPVATIIYQIGYILYFLWFVFIMATIKVQSEHQSGIDIKFGLFVVYKDPIRQQKVVKKTVKKQNIIMTEQPGNFNEDNLKDLKNDERTRYEKSISLDDLDIKGTENLLDKKDKDDDEPKQIEGDNK